MEDLFSELDTKRHSQKHPDRCHRFEELADPDPDLTLAARRAEEANLERMKLRFEALDRLFDFPLE